MSLAARRPSRSPSTWLLYKHWCRVAGRLASGFLFLSINYFTVLLIYLIFILFSFYVFILFFIVFILLLLLFLFIHDFQEFFHRGHSPPPLLPLVPFHLNLVMVSIISWVFLPIIHYTDYVSFHVSASVILS